MRYKRFEQLPVWQQGTDLAVEVLGFTKTVPLRPSVRNQLERAALSVSNNIAEGFERGSTQDLINFLYIARGSAGEVRSILCVIERMLSGETSACAHDGGDGPRQQNRRSPHLPAVLRLKAAAESVSRQLYAWLEDLKSSAIKGQRHLTERSPGGIDA